MSNFTNQSKSSDSSYTQSGRSATTWNPYTKAGEGWLYDQANITYDGEVDPVSGNKVYYDALGTAPGWANQNKS